jgi:hypothetical protein
VGKAVLPGQRGESHDEKEGNKIIMAATCCGNRRWAEDVFAYAKRHIIGNPSNADVCYRVMCYIYNTTNKSRAHYDENTMRSHSIAMRLRELYGVDVGGVVVQGFESTGR